jgi:hypothetical protein
MGRGIADVEILYSSKKHGRNPCIFGCMMVSLTERAKMLMSQFEGWQKGAVRDDRSVWIYRKVRAGHLKKSVDEAGGGHGMIEHMRQAMRDILSVPNDCLKKGFVGLVLVHMTVCERILELEPMLEILFAFLSTKGDRTTMVLRVSV